MGKIHYDPNNVNACNEFPATELNRTQDVSPFFLAKRGGCSFVQKVRNFENIGVAVGIVIDSFAEDIEGVLMSDDGTGAGIRIPSMLIGSIDGEKLIKWYVNATEEEKQQLVIMCEFEMRYNSRNVVDYDFWMT